MKLLTILSDHFEITLAHEMTKNGRLDMIGLNKHVVNEN